MNDIIDIEEYKDAKNVEPPIEKKFTSKYCTLLKTSQDLRVRNNLWFQNQVLKPSSELLPMRPMSFYGSNSQ